ncbi:MAG TPA: NAD(P)H-dependent oxidoreductase [Candidatus Methanofastidiosa archaeon]|nr:NAD(P)H-dependent oxidoreductase [Candidatus Methanofastidiosa archaeon]
MKVLVLYYSLSGNTKKLAEAVAEGVRDGGAEPVLRSAEEVTKEEFAEAAGIIAGSPVYFGTMAWQLKKVFDEFVGLRRQGKTENKIGAAFATSGNGTGGKETTIFSIIKALMIYGCIIVGDPMEATGHYGVGCVGAPDELARANAGKLGKRVALLAGRLGEAP